jgi:diaminohydroxyphosphoribosylaminopyrimidine deaminase / 5-amino-6-(5-phosphoribosylamino)uracil reductase
VAERPGDAANHMEDALRLAARAQGRTWPNPAVGAVIVCDGRVIGRGATRPPGGPHAEIVALREAGEAARGATLYVTLEPCCHVGRTGPCTDAVVAAGISRVVASVEDPYPAVAGKGFAALRDAGIVVETGVMAEDGARLIAGFAHRMRTGRPLVTLKWAMTLDGKIATRSGSSQWITGPDARLEVHRMRDRSDAIAAGPGTIRADDPRLTTRLPEAEAGEGGPHHPLRLVLDPRGTTPPAATVFDPATPGETRVVASPAAPAAWRHDLEARGVPVSIVDAEGPGWLAAALAEAGSWGINTLLVEGGGRFAASLLEQGLAGRVAAFIGAKVIGGADAPTPVEGAGVEEMADAWRVLPERVIPLGSDLLLEGRLVAAKEAAGV